MQSSCHQGFCNGATSSESICGHGSAVRHERRGQISDVSDGGVARSARTRRVVTRGRLEVRQIENGMVRKRDLLQYRVESVRHDTSPSCRDDSRQGPACPRRQLRLKSLMPRPSALFVRSATPSCVSGQLHDIPHLRLARARYKNPAWRHSDKELPFPHCYGFCTDNRLLKRRLRAHRRRFARSPRFRYRAGLKIVGAANDLRNTLSGKTRNEIDSHLRHQKT